MLSVAYDNNYDDTGLVQEAVTIYFRLIALPGTFSVQVPFTQNWNAIAFFQIGEKAVLVRGIYMGLESKADLPEPASLIPQAVRPAAAGPGPVTVA